MRFSIADAKSEDIETGLFSFKISFVSFIYSFLKEVTELGETNDCGQ